MRGNSRRRSARPRRACGLACGGGVGRIGRWCAARAALGSEAISSVVVCLHPGGGWPARVLLGAFPPAAWAASRRPALISSPGLPRGPLASEPKMVASSLTPRTASPTRDPDLAGGGVVGVGGSDWGKPLTGGMRSRCRRCSGRHSPCCRRHRGSTLSPSSASRVKALNPLDWAAAALQRRFSS